MLKMWRNEAYRTHRKERYGVKSEWECSRLQRPDYTRLVSKKKNYRTLLFVVVCFVGYVVSLCFVCLVFWVFFGAVGVFCFVFVFLCKNKIKNNVGTNVGTNA